MVNVQKDSTPKTNTKARKIWEKNEIDKPKSPPTTEYIGRHNAAPQDFTYLALNENSTSVTEQVKELLQKSASQIFRYPDNFNTELSQAVFEQTNVSAESQIWGAGASDLIQRVVSLNHRNGLHIVSPFPTFWGYERIYNIIDADVSRIKLDDDAHTNVDAMISAIKPNTGVVTFSTPANPSGLAVPEKDIIKFATQTPDHILLLVDEVYVEYATYDGAADMVELLRKHRPNGKWLILRSFSKAYGLAAARIGYGLASDPKIVSIIESSSINFTVSGLAFSAALAAFTDTDNLNLVLKNNSEQRSKIQQDLETLGLEYIPTSANFISIKMPKSADHYVQKLFEQKVICASWNVPDSPNHLRVSLTNDIDRNKFISALRDIL